MTSQTSSIASRLQRAFLPVLERWDHPGVARGELENTAAANYEREIGKAISTRQVRRLLRRIVDADRGRKDWLRLELYCFREPSAATHRADLAGHEEAFAPLLDLLAGFESTLNPSPEEAAAFWLEAWTIFREQIRAGVAPKRSKANLLRFLMRHASWLTGSPRNAVRVMVQRKFAKLAHASQAGLAAEATASMDGRHAKRGQRAATAIPPSDIDKLVGYALFNCGGRQAQAERELSAMGRASGISDDTIVLFGKDNRRLAKQVRKDIDVTYPYTLGGQAIDDATASLTRNPPKHSLEFVTGDDFTFPVYYRVPTRTGEELIRGQCLLFLDVRSFRIIAHTEIPSRSYSALNISSGMNAVCFEHGIPDTWYFERGIWNKSRLVKRTAPPGWEIAGGSPAEIKHGWERLGVRFIHAHRARSKPVELAGGRIQALMERCKGYCGRNEKVDCPETTRRALLAARRTNPDRDAVAENFYSAEEWYSVLDGLIKTYNASPQPYSRYLEGRAPDQAFEEFWPSEHIRKTDPTFWHLVAHYRRECFVDSEGIRFRLGKVQYHYFDEALSQYRNERVQIWFDPTRPEILGVTDLNKQNPIFVQRSNNVEYDAAFSTGRAHEVYLDELEKQAGFNRYPKARLKTVKAAFDQTYRQNSTDRATAALGREMLDKRVEAVRLVNDDEKRRDRIVRLAKELGHPVGTLRDFSDETEQSLRRRLERRRTQDLHEDTQSIT